MDFPDQVYQFIDGKLPEKDFGDAVHKVAMDVLTIPKEKKQEFYTLLAECLPKLNDRIFSVFPRPFLILAFNIADRLIYAQLKAYQLKFDNFQDLSKPNDLALFLIHKFTNSENKFLQVYYIDERMDHIKQLDFKFVLLEMYLKLVKTIDNKHDMYKNMLPNIFRPLKDGVENIVQFYLQNRLEDEKVGDQKGYYNTFSMWILDYIKRVLSEVKSIKELKNFKGIVQINQLFDSDEIGQTIERNDNPNALIKHYSTLFFLDIFDQLYTLVNISEQKVEYIQKAYEFVLKALKEFLGDHPQALIFTAIHQFRFLGYKGGDPNDEDEIQRNVRSYSPYTTFNITSLQYFLLELLKSPSFTNIYNHEYQIKLLVPIFVAFYRQCEKKITFKWNLLEQLIQNFELTFNKQPAKKYTSLNYFEADIVEVIDHILANFGAKTQIEEFVAKLVLKFDFEVQIQLIQSFIMTQHGQLFLEYFTQQQITEESSFKTEENIFCNHVQIKSLVDKTVDNLKWSKTYLSENTRQIYGYLYLFRQIFEINTQLSEKEKLDDKNIYNSKNYEQFTSSLTELNDQIMQQFEQTLEEATEEQEKIKKSSEQDNLPKIETQIKNLNRIKENLEFLCKK